MKRTSIINETFRSHRVPMVVIDSHDDKIKAYNQKAKETLCIDHTDSLKTIIADYDLFRKHIHKVHQSGYHRFRTGLSTNPGAVVRVDATSIKDTHSPKALLIFSNITDTLKKKKRFKEDQQELKRLNRVVADEKKKRSDHEEILIRQSKSAAMGRMIDTIAHQWKQPLNIIAMYAAILTNDDEAIDLDDLFSKEEIGTKISYQIEHLLSTLNAFRSFFRPDKISETFSIVKCIENVKELMYDDLIKNKINITTRCSDTCEIMGYENEFKHVIINLINNAKDAFNERNLQNRIIHISIKNGHRTYTVKVEDNAGGINEEILPNLFQQGITSKSEESGSGMGLYMSRLIMEKLGGSIRAKNSDAGATFILKIPVEIGTSHS